MCIENPDILGGANSLIVAMVSSQGLGWVEVMLIDFGNHQKNTKVNSRTVLSIVCILMSCETKPRMNLYTRPKMSGR